MPVSIGVVGAGLVGSGWVIVFARAGYSVRVYDQSPEIREQLMDQLGTYLADLETHQLIDDVGDVLKRIKVVDTLDESLHDVTYVQESVLERTEVKRAAYEAIDARVTADVAVGSSSSGIPASAFTEGLHHASNYLIAHPVNPPHLVPVVELVPAPWTSDATVARVYELMEAAGQIPVRVNAEVEGFILNRLQGALLREAWALFEAGYASTSDIDKTVAYGLGLRWSFMGPFETIDLNAPGGVRDYAERLGNLYLSIARDRTNPQPWSDDLISRVENERRQALPLGKLPERSAWRDRQLMALAMHKERIANVNVTAGPKSGAPE